jgi:TolB-like protein
MNSRIANLLATMAVVMVAAPTLAFAQGDAPTADAVELQLVEYPIAILPFRERGKEVENMGGQMADLVFAKLVVDPGLFLVDREDIDKTFAEAELTLSGIVNPKEAITIGQLTGARLIVTGSVFQVDNTVYCVAKIIGTETSRVVGASVKEVVGSGLDGMSGRLSDEIIRSIRRNADALVAKPVAPGDRIAALNKSLGDAKRPTVMVSVEERHVGRPTIDPAAETELVMFCKETGFTVIDADQGSSQQAKYLIQGEGMSEFAGRHGNLASVKARLEVKVVDRATGKVVAVDRQTRVAVDLVEQIAGKTALQEAAADVAERLLPKIVNRKEALQ